MAVDVLRVIIIARPREAVAAYATDPANAPEWYVNIKSIEWKTSPPLEVGSRFAFTATFLGRKLAYTYEVVEFIEGERLIMRTSEGPFPMETRYNWADAIGGATIMMLRNRGEPTGFSKVLAPFMSIAMGRANRKDLAALKSILEAR